MLTALADTVAGVCCLALAGAWYRWHEPVIKFYERILRIDAPRRSGEFGRVWWMVSKWSPVVLFAAGGVTGIVKGVLSV